MSDFESMKLVGECVNITIPQYSTETIEIYYKDEDGEPIDLDGSLLKWAVDDGSGNLIIEANSDEVVGSYMTILDQTLFKGKATLTIVGDDTATLAHNKGYPHGFMRVDTNDEPDQLLGGTFKLSKTIPR